MPILKAGNKLIFYAHVPKCGGSAVETYMHARFGNIAFHNTKFLKSPEAQRWTKTSPQHVDVASLNALFPKDFFDASFAIVRHPVGRLVSAFHFQREVERKIPAQVTFGEWLEDIPELLAESIFAHDNHIRPMADLVPAEAKVFHLEHGMDALVPWFDEVTGSNSGPRAVPHVNRKGEYTGSKTERVSPSEAEIIRIAEIFAVDFERFSYDPFKKEPMVPSPTLSSRILRERDIALKQTAPTILDKIKAQAARVLKP